MKYPTDSLWQHMCPISRDQCKQNSHESYLLFINFLSVVRFYPSISVSRSAGYKVHLKLMVKVALILFIIHPSQTDGRGCTSFSFQSLSTSKHSILSIILSISVSFQLFLMKIAPLESSRYPLFNRIKRRHPLGRLR